MKRDTQCAILTYMSQS